MTKAEKQNLTYWVKRFKRHVAKKKLFNITAVCDYLREHSNNYFVYETVRSYIKAFGGKKVRPGIWKF